MTEPRIECAQEKGVCSIPPVRRTISVRTAPDKAFDLFTQHMAEWWPLGSHSLSGYECGAPATSCHVEGHTGGKVYEIMADGRRRDWGTIQSWEPGRRFVFSWYVGIEESRATEVEVSFDPAPGNSTMVTLEHRHWDRMGEDGAQHRDEYAKGWIEVFDEGFGNFADQAS